MSSTLCQVSEAVKSQVPDDVKEKAREMARQELERRLEELNMSVSEAKGYGRLLTATQTHMLSLHDLLERTSCNTTNVETITVLIFIYQTWRRKKKSGSGSSARPTASSTIRVLRKVSLEKLLYTSAVGWRNLKWGGLRSSKFIICSYAFVQSTQLALLDRNVSGLSSI